MTKKKQPLKRPWPIWKLVLADLVALGLALVIFALFHHVIPRHEEAVGVVSQRISSVESPETNVQPIEAAPETTELILQSVATEIPEMAATPELTLEPTPEPTADPVGYFGTKYADKFTDGEVIHVDNTYQSANVNITVTKMREKGSDCYFADIYIKDITCLQSAFAKETFGRGYADWPRTVAEREGSILAINGDYYGTRDSGVVIRNGVLYREDSKITRDVGVIYWDGTMRCFSPDEFDTETEMERGAYQAWNFGPMLLDQNGNAMTEFNSNVNPANPRAVIGYFEPGHYCMLVVDGRTNQSTGLSLKNLSQLLESMGCSAAYNLDGGQTAVMVCGTEVINKQANGGRQCSDYIMILDEVTESFDNVERG